MTPTQLATLMRITKTATPEAMMEYVQNIGGLISDCAVNPEDVPVRDAERAIFELSEQVELL